MAHIVHECRGLDPKKEQKMLVLSLASLLWESFIGFLVLELPQQLLKQKFRLRVVFTSIIIYFMNEVIFLLHNIIHPDIIVDSLIQLRNNRLLAHFLTGFKMSVLQHCSALLRNGSALFLL